MLVAMQQKWVKRLDGDIFEIRSKVASNIQRALYFQKVNQEYVITYGFTKKRKKRPKKKLNVRIKLWINILMRRDYSYASKRFKSFCFIARNA